MAPATRATDASRLLAGAVAAEDPATTANATANANGRWHASTTATTKTKYIADVNGWRRTAAATSATAAGSRSIESR